MAYFFSSSSSVTAGGFVFGISMNEVTPPATAARASLAMQALWVRPGSRKCTWSSIRPGTRILPVRSYSWSAWVPAGMAPMRSMRPSRMRTSAWKRRPSLMTSALRRTTVFMRPSIRPQASRLQTGKRRLQTETFTMSERSAFLTPSGLMLTAETRNWALPLWLNLRMKLVTTIFSSG